MDIFYYNIPIYKEILLKFLQSTEKYYVSRTPFHFRRRAEAVLRRTARLRKAFSTAYPSTPKKWFYTSIWAMFVKQTPCQIYENKELYLTIHEDEEDEQYLFK